MSNTIFEIKNRKKKKQIMIITGGDTTKKLKFGTFFRTYFPIYFYEGNKYIQKTLFSHHLELA